VLPLALAEIQPMTSRCVKIVRWTNAIQRFKLSKETTHAQLMHFALLVLSTKTDFSVFVQSHGNDETQSAQNSVSAVFRIPMTVAFKVHKLVWMTIVTTKDTLAIVNQDFMATIANLSTSVLRMKFPFSQQNIPRDTEALWFAVTFSVHPDTLS